jgi:6-pyruvoyltetrahydropterin/6-carboxytetrahydropterin synthase
VIALTRRYRFPAAHVLCLPGAPQEESRRIYGRCANPAGHGHNYGVEVTVTGPVDERTGRILDPDRLDRLFEERVTRRFAHRMLNDEPAFSDRVPTAENIARAIYEQREEPVAREGPVRLLRVRVLETRRNAFVYGEDQ